MSDFQDYVQGLQMLGGVLALPRSAQYAQESAEAHRRMLQDTGIDPADIKEMYPDAPLQWLAASDKGIGGKILGGVGDVGALLSTIAGQPIGPPRMGISDIANAAKMRKQYKEEQSLNELAKTETDPVGKALLGTGSMDAYGRYKAAQLRAQGGAGGLFGTSEMGMRSRLAWLKQNKPDSPEIPALEKGIADYEARHPTPPPPQPRVPPGEAYTQRHDAMMQSRQKEAAGYGYKPGTPEYNYFFKQALAAEKQRAAGMGDVPNMDNVTKTAQAAWDAYQAQHNAKGGTTPPQTPTPPTGPPAPPPAPTPGPVSTGEPPPPNASSQQITTASPEQLAARKNIFDLAQKQGVDPRALRETNPDLWAAADLTGTENLPAEQFYQLLNDPVAFAQWRAGQAAQTQQPAGMTGPEGSPLNKEFDYNALTPEGKAQADQIKADMQAGKIQPGVAAARLQALPRR